MVSTSPSAFELRDSVQAVSSEAGSSQHPCLFIPDSGSHWTKTQSQKRVGHLGSLLEDVLVDDSKNPLDAESQYVNFDSSAPGMRRTDFSPEHLSLRGQAPCRRPLGKTFMCTPLFQPRELPLALLQNSLHYLVRLPPTPVSCCESSFLRLSGFAKPTLLLLLLLHSHSWR